MTGARRFEEAGGSAVGISRDSPWTHIAWQQVLELDFQLLSDFNAEATLGFGIGLHVPRPARRPHAVGVPDRRERYGPRRLASTESSDVPDVDELIAAAQAL